MMHIAIETPMWIISDSTYDMLDWYDPRGKQAVVPVAPSNPRNTGHPKDIEYRNEMLEECAPSFRKL
jgi:hypothetical protein